MSEDLAISKLVRVYLKMRDKRTELANKFKEEDDSIKEQMDKVKSALLDHCKTTGSESVRTTEGMFYRSVRTNYWTSDWESLGKFILQHQVPELLEKRIHQGNMKQFLQDHPELLPPGLNVDSEFTITVRKK